jgi:hypothetical protein
MRKRRSALKLPRYVIRLWSKRSGVWTYFWNLPGWARKAGCPVQNEPLGADYEAAVKRAETVLLPAFDSWRGGGATAEADTPAKQGTLDWLFEQYRADRRLTKLPIRSTRNRESCLRLVGGHILNDGRRLGTVRLTSVTSAWSTHCTTGCSWSGKPTRRAT